MPPKNTQIREVDTGGKHEFRFEASCDGKPCGFIEAHKKQKRLGGRVVYVVGNVDVLAGYRRRGIGTMLYTAAANEACRRRARLASTGRNPGAHSNDFWEKQHTRGRVKVVKVRGSTDPAYVLPCPVPSLEGLRRKRGWAGLGGSASL